MNPDHGIEEKIESLELTAPSITPADIEANIASEHYIRAGEAVRHDDSVADMFHFAPSGQNIGTLRPLELLTICVLVLRNGFTVVGKSACVSPENFDAEMGRKIARQDAVDQMWSLMGYALKERLSA